MRGLVRETRHNIKDANPQVALPTSMGSLKQLVEKYVKLRHINFQIACKAIIPRVTLELKLYH